MNECAECEGKGWNMERGPDGVTPERYECSRCFGLGTTKQMTKDHPAYRAALRIDPVSAEFASHGIPYAQARIDEIAKIIEDAYDEDELVGFDFHGCFDHENPLP